MNKRTVQIAIWHQLNNIEDKHQVHHDVMYLYEDQVFVTSKPTTQMRINNGIWTVSTWLYGVEIISCAADVRMALKGVKQDLEYVESGLYESLLRQEVMA